MAIEQFSLTDIAIGDIIFITFYYFVIHHVVYAMTDLQTFWYRVFRVYLLTKKRDRVAFLPPGGIFGIAWAVIYFLDAVAIYIVWSRFFYDPSVLGTLAGFQLKRYNLIQACFILFFINIYLNKVWTLVFFQGKSYLISLILIVILFITIVPIIVIFYYLEFYWAASLLIPYPIWLCIAFYLNLMVYQNGDDCTRIWNNIVADDASAKESLTIYANAKDFKKAVKKYFI
jgi:translocator protein